jgi:hypothetical protein
LSLLGAGRAYYYALARIRNRRDRATDSMSIIYSTPDADPHAFFDHLFSVSIEIYLATFTLGAFQLSFWTFGPTELRILLIIGDLFALRAIRTLLLQDWIRNWRNSSGGCIYS